MEFKRGKIGDEKDYTPKEGYYVVNRLRVIYRKESGLKIKLPIKRNYFYVLDVN